MLKQLSLATLISCVSITCAAFQSANEMETFKHSWTAKALKLQREIDLNTPLNEATFIGTHNSYNAKHYQIPFLRYLDPNHLLSIYDQLELGVRSIELDAHWTSTNSLSKDILLCHGLPSHWGCSVFDRAFTEGLAELRDWLKANPNEIVLLYIERHLDGHEPRLAAELDQYVGPFIFKPESLRKQDDISKSCVALPATTLTKADILKTGKQLVIVAKACDGPNPHYEEQDTFPQQWNDFVFAGIGNLSAAPFTILDSGIDDFTHYPDCGKSTTFSPDAQHTTIWRILEDRTVLSFVIHQNYKDIMYSQNVKELLACGVNWPAMDMLQIGDERLNAAIWSWAQNYPLEGLGKCAYYEPTVGIKNMACQQTMASFACKEEKTQQLKTISAGGPWSSGETMCQLYAGKNWHFATPVNGQQMHELQAYMLQHGQQEAWLNYAESKNQWRVQANGFVA